MLNLVVSGVMAVVGLVLVGLMSIMTVIEKKKNEKETIINNNTKFFYELKDEIIVIGYTIINRMFETGDGSSEYDKMLLKDVRYNIDIELDEITEDMFDMSSKNVKNEIQKVLENTLLNELINIEEIINLRKEELNERKETIKSELAMHKGALLYTFESKEWMSYGVKYIYMTQEYSYNRRHNWLVSPVNENMEAIIEKAIDNADFYKESASVNGKIIDLKESLLYNVFVLMDTYINIELVQEFHCA